MTQQKPERHESAKNEGLFLVSCKRVENIMIKTERRKVITFLIFKFKFRLHIFKIRRKSGLITNLKATITEVNAFF
jgi:hypothetical protein